MADAPDFSDETINTGIQATGLQTDQRLWLRQCKLVVSDAAGNGYDLSNLRVQFRVQSRTMQTLKSAEITVLNLSRATLQSIFSQKEFTHVSLSAGYQNGSPFGQIFSGKIAYLRIGRQDALTSFLGIVATDGDDAYNWATINVPLGEGATPQDQLNAVLAVLKDYNITAGVIPTLPTTKLPRGKALYGVVREVLTDLAQSVGCDWHLADGKLNFVSRNAGITGEVIILTPQTGLIGAPEQTLGGLNVRALLNPYIITGRLIQVKMEQTSQIAYGAAPQPSWELAPPLPSLAANGIYRVYSLTHEGDTRGSGNDWISVMVAINQAPGSFVPTAYTNTAVPFVNGS